MKMIAAVLAAVFIAAAPVPAGANADTFYAQMVGAQCRDDGRTVYTWTATNTGELKRWYQVEVSTSNASSAVLNSILPGTTKTHKTVINEPSHLLVKVSSTGRVMIDTDLTPLECD